MHSKMFLKERFRGRGEPKSFSTTARSMIARVVVAGGCCLLLGFPLCARQLAPSPAAQNPPTPPPAEQPNPQQTPAAPETSAPPQAKPALRTPQAARQDSWEILRGGLAEKFADRRAQAISSLGTIGVRPDVVRLIEAGLQDKTLEVREAAAQTLGDMKARSAIPKLRVALDDDSAAVSFSAAQALWAMGDHSGVSILIQVLAGERKAAPGLIHAQWHDMQEKLHDPKELAELGASETAGAFLGPAGFGVTVVEELAKDKTSAAKAISARLLGHDSSPEVRDALDDALDNKSWVVRASAAEAMGRIGGVRSVNRLSPLLDDSHPEVRYSAAAAIVRLMEARPAPVVRSSNPRRGAAEASTSVPRPAP